MNFISKEQVQFALDMKEPDSDITVIFLKKDGNQRMLKGNLIPSNTRKIAVPVETVDGIRSFRLDRVLFIN